MSVQSLLVAVCVFLFMIYLKLDQIGNRLKERFPTRKEEDLSWALKDPMGHWEAHKEDKDK